MRTIAAWIYPRVTGGRQNKQLVIWRIIFATGRRCRLAKLGYLNERGAAFSAASVASMVG